MAAVNQPTIGIIGSGPAALVTAHTLIKDGFTNVQFITRDSSAGGIWAKERVYPGLSLNKYVLLSKLPLPVKYSICTLVFMANSDSLPWKWTSQPTPKKQVDASMEK